MQLFRPLQFCVPLMNIPEPLTPNTHQLRRVELGKVERDVVHPVPVAPQVRGEALLLQLRELCLDLFGSPTR